MILTVIAVLGMISNRESIIGSQRISGETESLQLDYLTEAAIGHASWQASQSECGPYNDIPATPFGRHQYSASISPKNGSPVNITATGKLENGIKKTVKQPGVKFYQKPVSMIIQPGPEGKDGYISANKPTDNFGGQIYLVIDSDEKNSNRALVYFDLSKLPAQARLESAELSLFITANEGRFSDIVAAHELSRGWTEGSGGRSGASWLTYDDDNNWTKAGGDFVAKPSGSFVASGTGWKSMFITELAQDWLDGSKINNGVILMSPATIYKNPVYFSSGDAIFADQRPKLALEYSCPCGVDCAAIGDSISYCEADYEPTGKAFQFDWDPSAGDIAGIDFLSEGTVVNGETVPNGGGWIKADRNQDKLLVVDSSGALLTEMPFAIGDPRGIAFIKSGAWINHIAVTDNDTNAIYYFDLDGNIAGSFLTTGIPGNVYGMSFIGATETGIYANHLAIGSDKDELNGGNGTVFIVDQTGKLVKTLNVDSYAPKPYGIAHVAGENKLMVADSDGTITIIGLAGSVLTQYNADAWGYEEIQGLAIHPESCEHVINDKNAEHAAGLGLVAGSGIGLKNLLMVVANPGNLTDQEDAKKTLFESWNYTVSLIDDSNSQSSFDSAVAANHVVFVGADSSASRISKKLNSARIGVVNEEAVLSNKLGMSSNVSWSSGTVLNIDDNLHHITLPFYHGPLAIFGGDSDLADLSGTFAPELRILASTMSGPMLVTLDADAYTYPGEKVAGRRVHLPWGGSTLNMANLTAEGKVILERSLQWGVQTPPRCDADFAAYEKTSEFSWMAGTGNIRGIDYLPAGLVINEVPIPGGGGWIMADNNNNRLFVTDLAGNTLTDFSVIADDMRGAAFVDGGRWDQSIAVTNKGNTRHYVYIFDLAGDIVASIKLHNLLTNPLGVSFIGATESVVYDNHLAIVSDTGNAAIYVIDQQGALLKTIDIEGIAPKPVGVRHLTGSDKFLVAHDAGLISVVNFDGDLLHQYSTLTMSAGKPGSIAINPNNCEHVIVDKDFKTISSLSHYGGGGSNTRRYVPTYIPWFADDANNWASKKIDIFGVPRNSVVEIAVINEDGGDELWGGVRASGSSLERRVQLHEAGGGGSDIMTWHTQVDAAGYIEYFAEDPDKVSFIILGFWTGATYAENWTPIKAGASNTWQSHALNAYGVSPGQVVDMLALNNEPLVEREAGLRDAGSALPRIFNLHEAKDGGSEGVMLSSVSGTDAGASVELFAEIDASIDFYLAGHWTSPPGQYTTSFADLGKSTTEEAWEAKALAPYGVPANAIAQIAPVNGEDGRESFLGLRSTGSSQSRLLELHDSKNGGDEFASLHVATDAGSNIEWYDERPLDMHQFLLLGWWQLP
ncbi:MAG: DNRLRE domain-containing protein [Gammaproteobacteria bacterium]|nr:DNRLRE domain-containing protein [Gammaproteobacteria bacterium]